MKVNNGEIISISEKQLISIHYLYICSYMQLFSTATFLQLNNYQKTTISVKSGGGRTKGACPFLLNCCAIRWLRLMKTMENFSETVRICNVSKEKSSYNFRLSQVKIVLRSDLSYGYQQFQIILIKIP
jgi:hypothetical protein